jgi:hypothetical protein
MDSAGRGLARIITIYFSEGFNVSRFPGFKVKLAARDSETLKL